MIYKLKYALLLILCSCSKLVPVYDFTLDEHGKDGALLIVTYPANVKYDPVDLRAAYVRINRCTSHRNDDIVYIPIIADSSRVISEGRRQVQINVETERYNLFRNSRQVCAQVVSGGDPLVRYSSENLQLRFR